MQHNAGRSLQGTLLQSGVPRNRRFYNFKMNVYAITHSTQTRVMHALIHSQQHLPPPPPFGLTGRSLALRPIFGPYRHTSVVTGEPISAEVGGGGEWGTDLNVARARVTLGWTPGTVCFTVFLPILRFLFNVNLSQH